VLFLLCSNTARYGISVILLLVPVLTIGGNLVTILAVLTHRKLRTKTNAFIVSLAIADMCVSLLVMPFGIYQQLHNKVSKGEGWLTCCCC
jgi:hypothetical protein